MPRKSKDLKPYYTDYEIYKKYLRMIKNGIYTEKETIQIIAELNAVPQYMIREIIQKEQNKQITMGQKLYDFENQVNLKNGRW